MKLGAWQAKILSGEEIKEGFGALSGSATSPGSLSAFHGNAYLSGDSYWNLCFRHRY